MLLESDVIRHLCVLPALLLLTACPKRAPEPAPTPVPIAPSPPSAPKFDLDGDGFVTVVELAKTAPAAASLRIHVPLLSMFDLDRDSRWSKDELNNYMRMVKNPLSIRPEAIYQTPALLTYYTEPRGGVESILEWEEKGGHDFYDLNRDGIIERDELLTGLIMKTEHIQFDVLLGCFGMADAGGDGRLGDEELKRLRRLLPQDVTAPLSVADADQDGELDPSEQAEWLKAAIWAAQFGRIDTSGDGLLRADELAASARRYGPGEADMEIVMADTSADGAFDVAEYMVYKKALQTTGKLGLIDIGFHTADADGNGRLTSLEWGPFSAKLNGMPFGPFDIDKDDAVTLSEVLAVLRVLAQPPSD